VSGGAEINESTEAPRRPLGVMVREGAPAATRQARTATSRPPRPWRDRYGGALPATKTIPWDTADHLDTAADTAAYLEAAFEDGDPAVINHALGVVARARGMSEIAQQTGMGRQSLYKALSADGHPEFSTVLQVVRAPGLKLTVTAY
jgi:probable addiction module antidote protein